MVTRWSRASLIAGALIIAGGGCFIAGQTTRPGAGAAGVMAAGKTSSTSTSNTSSTALATQNAMESAAAVVTPKVVLVTSAAGLGSGEIYDSSGDIVTNYHVLSGGGAQLQPPFHVTLSNGTTYQASVRGTDSADDLAVLKINATNLKPISLGNSATLKVGQIVLAVGNPLGYAQTVTMGIVSVLNRGLPEGQPAAFLPNLIQTSAPINPGNSGGALVDLSGNLVGIPTLAAQDPEQGTAAEGIGFAIPVNRVTFIANQIIKSGKVTNSGRAYLGVSAMDVTPQLQAQYGLPVGQGVLVASVVSGGPAASSLKAGDIITAINGTSVTNSAELLDALSTMSPGQKVTLTVVNTSGKKQTVSFKLGTLPIPSA